jgi:CheY-like chemotaxis protein
MASQGVLLVVDDEAEIREIIAMNAAPLGLDVLEAGDGHQAIEILKEHHVDVVISDLMMPRVSGLTLLTMLREERWAKPFIFVTAYPS